jgi:aminopeptidase YwaD
MKKLLAVAAVTLSLYTICNAGNKGKKRVVAQLKADIFFLASDSLEGRRMGTEGEKIAASYIAARFSSMALQPFFDGSFTQAFTVTQGLQLAETAYCAINEQELDTKDYVILPFSGNTNVNQILLPKVKEKNVPVFVGASAVGKKNLSNPHDDAIEDYKTRAAKELGNGATAIIFYNDMGEDYDAEFDAMAKSDTVYDAVCIYLNHNAYTKVLAPALKTEMFSIDCDAGRIDKVREGLNVAGFYNNDAPKTIVIGAHYDHLGFGEDHNSLHSGQPAIHNGADDNASGVGAVLALAARAKKFSTKYNYLFIAFSGEELGLYGSKKFLEQNAAAVPSINCMINIDMLGRFDAAKNTITIGGVGSSPAWIPMVEASKKTFVAKYDSSGIGPSDHTSFYLKDKPVLFFFTGLHSDYHKPSDDAEKINYEGEAMLIDYIEQLIVKTSKQNALTFTKTREQKIEGVKFKVTMGIMPDYTFSGSGVRADGISEGKVAAKVGMQTGDIIVALGEHRVLSLETYMKALSKFKKGDSTTVSFMRGDTLVEKQVTFE